MAVERHHEHSFDPSLFRTPDKFVAVDLGCRGFGLTEYLARNYGGSVVAVDADRSVFDHEAVQMLAPCGVRFVHSAVVGSEDAKTFGASCAVKHSHDPNATRVVPGAGVPCVTILELMHRFTSGSFPVDLLKIDVEGSEYGIVDDLASIPYPLANQISVEFHDHCGLNPPGGLDWFAGLPDRLGRTYRPTKFSATVPPWGGRPAFWDCLFTAF